MTVAQDTDIPLSTYLATPVTASGTNSDVHEDTKSDRTVDDDGNPLLPVNADEIATKNGAELHNQNSAMFLKSYQSHHLAAKLYSRADATARDGLGSLNGLAVDDLLYKRDDQTLWYVVSVDGASASTWAALGITGDVTGPASSVDHALARFDGAGGKTLQNSVGILTDAGDLSGLNDIALSGTVDGVDVATQDGVHTAHAASGANPHSVILAQVLTSDGGTGGAGDDITIEAGDPLIFEENATVPGGVPAAGSGKLWCRNDAPNVIIWTDDTGVDRILAESIAVSVDNTVPRFDGVGGLFQGSGLVIDDSDGLNIPGTLAVGGKVTLSDALLLAGGDTADADAGYDDQVIGTGDATPRGITFHVLTGTDSGIAWNDGTNTLDGYFAYGGSSFQFRLNNVLRYNMGPTRFEPVAGQDIGLGRTQDEGWGALALAERADHFGTPAVAMGEVWLRNDATQSLMLTDDDGNDWQIGGDTQTMNTLLVGGAAFADADASANDGVFGDGSATARGVTFVGTSTSDMSIAFSDGTLLTRGEIRLENSATPDRWVFRIANVDRLALDTTFFGPTTDAALGMGAVATRGWSNLALTERADHVGVPTATRGEVWLRNDASPNTLMFTDDDGDDHPLSLMDPVHFDPTEFYLPGTGGAVISEDGASFAHSLRFADAITNTAYKNFVLPRTYSGNGLTVRIVWADDSAAGGNLRCTAAFERHDSAFDQNTASFSSQSFTVAGNGTVGLVNIDDLAFTDAQIDGMLAGEVGRFRFQRLGADALDTLNGGNVDVLHIEIIENP